MSSIRSQRWNLSDLYSSLKDPQIKKDIKAVEKQARSFQKKYRGKILKEVRTADTLLSALTSFEMITSKLAKPVIYAQLLFSCETDSAEVGAFMQECRAQWTTLQQYLQFFEIELLTLHPAKTLCNS